jgi:hypothetical protein
MTDQKANFRPLLIGVGVVVVVAVIIIIIAVVTRKKTSSSSVTSISSSSTSTNWPLDGLSYGLKNVYAASSNLGNYMYGTSTTLLPRTSANTWKLIKHPSLANTYYIQQTSDLSYLDMGTTNVTESTYWLMSLSNGIYTIAYNGDVNQLLGYRTSESAFDVGASSDFTSSNQTQWQLI